MVLNLNPMSNAPRITNLTGGFGKQLFEPAIGFPHNICAKAHYSYVKRIALIGEFPLSAY